DGRGGARVVHRGRDAGRGLTTHGGLLGRRPRQQGGQRVVGLQGVVGLKAAGLQHYGHERFVRTRVLDRIRVVDESALADVGDQVGHGSGSLLAVDLDEFRLRSEEHTSELQSRENLVCRLLLEKKNINNITYQ